MYRITIPAIILAVFGFVILSDSVPDNSSHELDLQNPNLVEAAVLDAENRWPMAQRYETTNASSSNLFSWEIDTEQPVNTATLYPIKIRVLYSDNDYEFSGKVKIFHGDVGTVSTASGLLRMGSLMFLAEQIPLGNSLEICSKISEDWSSCHLRSKRHEIAWEKPKDPTRTFNKKNLPGILIHDLDRTGSPEIIFQKWSGNRGGAEFTVYQKDLRGIVSPTVSFRGSSELRDDGRVIQTRWSSNVCDGNVDEIYRSIEGRYTLMQRKTYFMDGGQKTDESRNCGYVEETYDQKSNKYLKRKVF